MIRVFLIYILTVSAFSIDIVEKYPSYSYVFSEFNIDEEYVYNSNFNSFVQQNHNKYKNFYQHSVRRGGYLVPTFKSLLIQDGLSDLFVYLSMVESGFQTDALSPKQATGLWQFMEATAKQYKLDINSNFDERLDPILATNAAMRYLHKLYGDFGKWYLVMMAYNCGEGRLQKAIERAGSDRLEILMDNQKGYIPKETRIYINKILLLSMIGENITLGFGELKEDLTMLYGDEIVQVEVEAGENIASIAKSISIDPKELLNINHHFKQGSIPVVLPYYMMNIPSAKVIDFYTSYLLKKELAKENQNHFISHIVISGENIEQIASKYKVSIGELIVANSLKKLLLSQGDMLIIPVTEDIFTKFSKHI